MKEAMAALAASILPTFMVLIGILLNRNDINRLDARITALETSLRGEINSFRNEFNNLRAQMHSDMMMLMSANGDIDKRISKLEETSEKQ